jgi:pseudouridine-5'-phosphate glycosidase
MTIDSGILKVSDEVQSALAANKPVVALESTVIAQGLPRPQNLETALRLEQIVRDAGAVPAIIAILDGRLCVGIDTKQLEQIATRDDIQKVSTRDLAVVIARQGHGATTVATTMWIAHRAGIKTFATGGIGGVHRGALADVSADLPELARTPMVVVCSGAKIVLDLPATREWLETNGVTVAGYECDEMPAFYSRHSGLAVDTRVGSAADVASLVRSQRALGLRGALLVTVPIPVAAEVKAEALQTSLDEAIAGAAQAGIGGRELTPYLLSRMAEQSGGVTLQANIALLENNAHVAAQIAAALSGG